MIVVREIHVRLAAEASSLAGFSSLTNVYMSPVKHALAVIDRPIPGLRADAVREFADRIEYTVGHQTTRYLQIRSPTSTPVPVLLCAPRKRAIACPAAIFRCPAIPSMSSDKEKKATDTPSRN